MARPLRIEFAGALYHVTVRGNAQGEIYLSDEDRFKFLSLLNNTCNRYNWHVMSIASCQIIITC